MTAMQTGKTRYLHLVRVSTPLGVYTVANQEWALDFVHDAVASGRSIRVLNVIDAYTRESLAMEVDTSFVFVRPKPYFCRSRLHG